MAGVTAKYRGKNTFFKGADQYKIGFCANEACETTLAGASLPLETKQGLGDLVMKDTNKQLKFFLLRTSGASRIDLSTRELTIAAALDLVKNPEGDFGESALGTEDKSKLENFLEKNCAKVKVYLADFVFSGLGDAAEAYIANYNAETGWVTCVLFASYVE